MCRTPSSSLLDRYKKWALVGKVNVRVNRKSRVSDMFKGIYIVMKPIRYLSKIS